MIEYESLINVNRKYLTEIETAVSRVIRSGYYVLGEEVGSFEAEFSQFMGSKYCVGVANGLDALTLGILALDLPIKSDILVPSNTYIATILAIIHAGHHPVLVEPDPGTLNINTKLLQNAMTRITRAICVVHLYGASCDMNSVKEFSEKNGLRIIEDCAQSHGARYKNQLTGTFGDIGCFSFYPTKNLGAMGDAGAIITNDILMAEKIRYLRNYGSKEKYKNKYIGYNSRLDEIQAAILRVKLKYLNEMNDYKRLLAKRYFELLPDCLQLPNRSPERFDVHHIFPVLTKKRDSLRDFLLKNGIKTEIHYPIPPHKQESLSNVILGDYPISSMVHENILSLPISIGMNIEDIGRVSGLINDFFKQAKE